jgi:hypothetical protein
MKGEKPNNIEKLRFTKVEDNGLIVAASYYHIVAIPHQPTEEFVNPNSLGF